jgi:hypothetical protein
MRAEQVPEGYDGSARYTVVDPEKDPDYPVYYTIDNSLPSAAFLMYQQPGPWNEDGNDWCDMFVRLETLVELGRLAQEILDGTAVSDKGRLEG